MGLLALRAKVAIAAAPQWLKQGHACSVVRVLNAFITNLGNSCLGRLMAGRGPSASGQLKVSAQGCYAAHNSPGPTCGPNVCLGPDHRTTAKHRQA